VYAGVIGVTLTGIARADPARDCIQEKDPDLAIRSCTLIIEGQATGKKGSAYHSRGVASYRKGDYDGAIADFSRAIELDPNKPNTYFGRGAAYYGKRDYGRALADYDRALELDPKFTHAYQGRGTVYNRQGDYAQAIADFSRALELDPEYAYAYAGRGAAYYNRDENDLAIADLSRAIELNPNDTKSYNNRGNAYSDKGETDRAIADFSRAIELSARDAGTYRARAIAYSKKGDHARAIADSDRAIELDPSDPGAYRTRGGQYLEMGQPSLAITDFTKAIELAPKNAGHYNARAWAYFKAGKAAQGLPDAERSLELRPNDTPALDTRAHIFEALGRREEAIADFRRALSKDPKLPESIEGLKRLGVTPEPLPAPTPLAEPWPTKPPAAPKAGAQPIYQQLELFGVALKKIRAEYADPVDDRMLIKNAIRGMAKAVPGLNEDPETKSAIKKLEAADPKTGTINALLNVFGGYIEHVRKSEGGWDSRRDEKLITAAIGGMLEGLDPHSSFIAGAGKNPCESGSAGIEAKLENETLKVVTAIDASPAMNAGIRGGDAITHVDGTALTGLSLPDAIAKLCGPAGSTVRVTLLREGQTSPIEINVVRERVRIKHVSHRLEGDVGWIKIKGFQSEEAYESLKKAIEDLQRTSGAKLKGYVIDLRGNSGGLLDEAIKVADAFLERGVIVLVRRRDETKPHVATSGDLTGGKPLAVLIDRQTASGAEIVASSLQGQHRATIVGVASFGMASIQTLIPLDAQRAMRLTTGRMFRANGSTWEGKGIEPDVTVQAQQDSDRGDAPFQAALDVLHGTRQPPMTR
jgi:carboxyl-terminal processing protease